MIRYLAPLLLVAAPVFAVPALAAPPKVGDMAPGFTARSFDDREISLADVKGKVVVLNFWATWCVPCRTELPLLDAFARINGKHGLVVIGITMENDVPMARLKPLAAAVNFTMARRFRGGYGQIKAVPTNFIIDRSGVLRHTAAGALRLDDLNRILIPLLQEPAPSNTPPPTGR
ncbi:TlpA disulfide reductase family protein [Sandarakinorhabdus sp.]|uniref:TlpA family protein disulfide reductase n=1 Tax=Sandarakinorhabdus sp. TaxID=1916663 RepID=UPI00286D9E9B|nr:TlpA disulfide reductase family protein [Sandarakinorhabdus sp.]